MMGFVKSKLRTKFEIASSSHCRYNKEEPPIFLGISLVQCHNHFSSGCDITMGLLKVMLHTKFEAAIVIHYGNTSEFPQKIMGLTKMGTPLILDKLSSLLDLQLPYFLYNFCGALATGNGQFLRKTYSCPYFGVYHHLNGLRYHQDP